MSLDLDLTRNYLGSLMPLSPDATNGVTGSSPGQTLAGKRGVSNWIISPGGGATLIGGDSGDTFVVVDPSDMVIAAPNSGINTIVSWTSQYALPANVQDLFLQSASGGIGVGNNLDNLLVAEGQSNYTLVAGTGNDVMIGNGSGDPQYDTGAGSTTFVIAQGDGNDVIANFRSGIDVARLVNFTGLTSLAAVQAAMTQAGPDVVLNLGGGQTLTFRNETVAAFQASDFMLPANLPGMSLRFDDEFNGFVSSPTGAQGWMTQGGAFWRTLSGNNEAEYYSDSSVGVNPFTDTNGVLTITAAPGSNPLGLPYDSGIITTEKSFNFEYGLVEVSAKLPAGAGLWPAIWLLPSSLDWPPEIDIMEMLGNDPSLIYASTHTGASNNSSTLPVYVGDTTQSFHTYGLDWEPNTITWYFDGNAIRTVATPSDMHQPMYLLINLAVGGAGSWPGAPTSAAEFPAQMSIDYVRIYGSSATTAVSGTAAQAPSPPVTIVGDTPTSGGGTSGSAPVVVNVAMTPASGNVVTGNTVTVTVTFSSVVTVAGGTPAVALSDGGTATYLSGSGSNTLVFSYSVAAGQTTADLTLGASNAIALNGATVRDAAGNNAVLTGANGYNPAGLLQINQTSSNYITPGSGSFTDAAGNVYTIDAAGNADENGSPIPDGGNTGAMEYYNGLVYGEDGTSGVWYTWNQSAWLGPVTAPPAPTSSTGSAPVISSVVTSPGSGDLPVGANVTLTVTFSSAVTVAGGTPTLALNDGGTATYVPGSGGNTLVFSYAVAAGQNTADLALAASNAIVLNGATIRDTAGNNAVLAAANGYNPAGTLQVDTTAPTVSAITASPGSGQVATGGTVTLTVTFSEPVTVAGGPPALALNDGGTAMYASGSGSNALVFSYAVAAGQSTADLALAASSAIALNGATIRDAAGNNAVLTAANGYNPAGTLSVNTSGPTITAIAASPASGDLTVGAVVTLTVTFSSAVTVAGGIPTLALNDGGTATYVPGSSSNTLVFSYAVAAGHSTPDLALAASNAIALNGATIRDAAGNNAVLTAANGYNPSGTLQIDATAPTVSAITTSPGSGQVATGATVTLTVSFTEPVTVAGGPPSLALNDGGTAKFVSGSGSSALVFSYAVAAGQSTADLALAASNAIALNGATIRDSAGNNAVLTAADGYNPTGTLSVNTGAISVVVSDWWNTYNLGSGTYKVSGSAGGAQITLGDGNQTVNVTGTNNRLTTGAGSQTITFNGNNNTVVTGNGTSTITMLGAYENVTVGATPTGTTTIAATGFAEHIASTGKGNVVVTGPHSNSTVKLADGNDTVTLAGSGNTVTVGVGTSTINIGIGQGTVHAGGGSDTILAAGWNNLLDAGPGMNFIHGGNGNDTFVLNGAGQGLDTVYGFTLTNRDTLDLTRTLASVASSVDLTNVGSYITAATSGGNTTLYVDPTGGHGTPYAFASLQGVVATVAQLVAQGDLIVP